MARYRKAYYCMRNLVIERITYILLGVPSLQLTLDIAPHELQSLSNLELLDLLEEILKI
jgi:hypothetical protein